MSNLFNVIKSQSSNKNHSYYYLTIDNRIYGCGGTLKEMEQELARLKQLAYNQVKRDLAAKLQYLLIRAYYCF